MYNLADFIPYTNVTNGTHRVLAWSKKDGYYFTQFGFCVGDDIKIIAQEK